jgi:hypothetical protein
MSRRQQQLDRKVKKHQWIIDENSSREVQSYLAGTIDLNEISLDLAIYSQLRQCLKTRNQYDTDEGNYCENCVKHYYSDLFSQYSDYANSGDMTDDDNMSCAVNQTVDKIEERHYKEQVIVELITDYQLDHDKVMDDYIVKYYLDQDDYQFNSVHRGLNIEDYVIRRYSLVKALSKYGLELRHDSKMCQQFIDGYHSLAEVVDMMREMDWLFKHTDYSKYQDKLMSDARFNPDYNNHKDEIDSDDDNFSGYRLSPLDYQHFSNEAKNQALTKWINDGKPEPHPPQTQNMIDRITIPS